MHKKVRSSWVGGVECVPRFENIKSCVQDWGKLNESKQMSITLNVTGARKTVVSFECVLFIKVIGLITEE